MAPILKKLVDTIMSDKHVEEIQMPECILSKIMLHFLSLRWNKLTKDNHFEASVASFQSSMLLCFMFLEKLWLYIHMYIHILHTIHILYLLYKYNVNINILYLLYTYYNMYVNFPIVNIYELINEEVFTQISHTQSSW